MNIITEKIIPGIEIRERKEPPKRRCTAGPTTSRLFADDEPPARKPRTNSFQEWSEFIAAVFQRLYGR
jgi:hypothetical protein